MAVKNKSLLPMNSVLDIDLELDDKHRKKWWSMVDIWRFFVIIISFSIVFAVFQHVTIDFFLNKVRAYILSTPSSS